TSFSTRWMLTASRWRRGAVESSRSCSTSPSRRSTSRMMMSVQRTSSGSLTAPRSSCAAPLMPPSGFLISCARPLATVPSAARRSARRVVASSVCCSVRSWSTRTAPRARPSPSTTGAQAALTGTSCPRAASIPSPRRRAAPSTSVPRAISSTHGLVRKSVPTSPPPGLELVDHLVEVLAGLLAELLPHLAHPARHALGIVLVEPGEGAVVGERVEPALLRAPEREARHQARERAAPAVLAHRLDRLAHAQGEDGHRPLTPPAAVLVDRHTDPDYSREP